MFLSGSQRNQRRKTLAGKTFHPPEGRVALLIASAINHNCSIKFDFLLTITKQIKVLYVTKQIKVLTGVQSESKLCNCLNVKELLGQFG